MDIVPAWSIVKESFADLVQYGLPVSAIIISILSYIDSRKANKVQERLYQVEQKIKEYELEDKEKEREESTKSCIEARLMKISKNSYKMKVWNSGKATAYNVDFKMSEEYKGLVWRDKVPYEFLEPGKSFEENVLITYGIPRKFNITTIWTNEKGLEYSKEQIVSF